MMLWILKGLEKIFIFSSRCFFSCPYPTLKNFALDTFFWFDTPESCASGDKLDFFS